MVWRSADWRHALALLLLIAAGGAIFALVSDSNESSDGTASSTDAATRGPSGASPESADPLVIDSPLPDERVPVAGGVAVLWVSGRGAAGQEVVVDTKACGSGCGERVAIDSRGEWKTRLVVPAKDRGSLTVRAAYADRPDGSTHVELVLGSARAENPSDTERRSLTMIGDSLAVGMEAPLAAQLKGWDVSVSGRIGRGLAEGLTVVDEQAGDQDSASSILAVSLFTNDSPGDVAALRSGVERVLDQVGPDGCVVWGAVVAPPIGGVSFAAANRELRRLAARHQNLRVVAWDRLVAREPELLEPDDTHPTYQGYTRLAELYARAARSCG